MVSWDDAYFLFRLVILETKIKCQAAVISEAEVSNEDSVFRIQKGVIKEAVIQMYLLAQEQLRPS